MLIFLSGLNCVLLIFSNFQIFVFNACIVYCNFKWDASEIHYFCSYSNDDDFFFLLKQVMLCIA